MILRFKAILLVSFLAVVSGCAGTVFKPVAPEVTIANVEIGKMQFPMTNIVFSIVVSNPNDFDIDIDYIDVKLHVMDYLISSEYWSSIAVLNAGQKQDMRVPVKVDVLNALTLLPHIMSENKVPYVVSGIVKLNNYSKELPFRYKGDFDAGQMGKVTLNNSSDRPASRTYRF